MFYPPLLHALNNSATTAMCNTAQIILVTCCAVLSRVFGASAVWVDGGADLKSKHIYFGMNCNPLK